MPYKDPEQRKKYHKSHYIAHRDAYLAGAKKQRDKRTTPEQKLAWHLYQRGRMLKQRYGMTLDDYDRMLKEQEGRCAICRSEQKGVHKRYLDIDHSHSTGKVRGLLCGACNKNLAVLENSTWRSLAEAYLGR